MNYMGMGGNGDYGLEILGFVNMLILVLMFFENILVVVINDM